MSDTRASSSTDPVEALQAAAEVHAYAGEWARAASTYRQALELEASGPRGPNPACRIRLLLGLASVLLTLHDAAAAEPLLREAQVLAEAGSTDLVIERLKVLNGLAALHSARGDRAALETTAMTWRELALRFPPTSYNEAVAMAGQGVRILTRVGGQYVSEDNLDAAVRWFEEARDVARKIGEVSDLRPVLYYLADVHWRAGRIGEAEALVVSALARISPDEIMRADPGADAILSLASHIAWLQGNRDAAIFLRKCALSQSHALEDEVAQHRKVEFRRHPPDWYCDLMNMLIARARLVEATVVRRSLDEAELYALINRLGPLDPRRTMTALTPREERWRRELCSRLERMRDARLRLDGRGETPNSRAMLRRRMYKAELQLRSWYRSLRDTGTSEAAIPASAIRAMTRRSVPPDVLVVSSVSSETRLIVQLNGSETISFLSRDIPAADLADRVFAFRAAIERGHADIAMHAAFFMSILGLTRLHEFAGPRQEDDGEAVRLLSEANTSPRPIPVDFNGPRRIHFDLDGALRQLPVAALGDANGWLVERASLTIVDDAPSTEPLGALPLVDPAEASDAPRLAAFGTTAAQRGFPALPSVAREIGAIVRDGASPGGALPGVAHLDAQFTREALANAARTFPIIHIASHFEFHPVLNPSSGLLLGDGSVLTLEELKGGDFDFSGVRLVTLSACETGIFGSEAGRALMSLASVIRQLGAGGVVATLWRVPDDGIARLMDPFYRGLAAGHDVAEALRLAQLDVLGLPPRSWSGPAGPGLMPVQTVTNPLGWAGVVYVTGTHQSKREP